MDWLALTLLCAFALASADAATKRMLADYRAREIVLIRFGFAGLLMAPLLLANPLPAVPNEFWAWVAALVPLEVLAMLLYMRAIRDHPLGLTLPYLAFTPVFATVTGYLLLGEQVSASGFAGIALVVLGAYLLNLEHVRSLAPSELITPLRAIARGRGSRLMLTVAALYSLTAVMGKGAMQYVPPEVFGPFYFVLLGAVVLAPMVVTRPQNITVLWRRPGAHFVVGLLMGIMVFTHFLAIQQVEVAYMIAVKRTSLLFGIGYGILLFHEPQAGVRLAAGTVMVAGVILIAL